MCFLRLDPSAPLSIAQLPDQRAQKILEELDYTLEASNIEDFYNNFKGDPNVKIPWVRKDLCGPKMLVMEWIDGVRCTDPEAVRRSVDGECRGGGVCGTLAHLMRLFVLFPLRSPPQVTRASPGLSLSPTCQ